MKYTLNFSGSRIAGAVVAIMSAVAMASCSGRSGAIDRMVDSLNSKQMQAAERRTGLFSGSEATVRGDTLQITFNLVEGLSLSGFNQAQIPALRQSAISEFQVKASEKSFATGLHALDDEDMVIKLVWRDVSGQTVSLVIDPADVVK